MEQDDDVRKHRGAVAHSHGAVGESRTIGLLGPHFDLLKGLTDVAGADFLVDEHATNDAAHDRARRRGIVTFGVIQAKYVKRRGHAYIRKEYAEDNGEPRPNFFLIVHSDGDDGRAIFYFLTSEDICQLPLDKAGRSRLFSITKKNDKSAFLNRPTAEIVKAIRSGVATARTLVEDHTIRNLFLPVTMRANFVARDLNLEYQLRRVDWPAADDPRSVAEARLVLVRSLGDAQAEPIDVRWDLYPTTGSFDWGYAGEGPKALAMSILGHYLGWGAKPTHRQHMMFLDRISRLERDQDHVIAARQIERALLEAEHGPIEAARIMASECNT